MTHAVRFQHPRYTIRRKFFRFFGDAFHLYTDDGELALYSNMKRFRIREDIRLYADESQDQELLRISTRSIFDFAGAYDVHDSQSDEHVGTLRRSGFKSSFLRDHWTFLDSGGQEIGTLQEDSMLKALVRRYIEALAFFLSPALPRHRGGESCGGVSPAVQSLHSETGCGFQC